MNKCMIEMVLVALLSAPGLSQTHPANSKNGNNCPIDIVSVIRYKQHEPIHQELFRVEYRNSSGKDISAIRFGAVFFNGVNKPFKSRTNYVDTVPFPWNQQLAARGKDQKPRFASWSLWGVLLQNLDFYPLQVTFADGTSWQDDGTYACNAGVQDLKIAKQGGLKSHAQLIAELDREAEQKKPRKQE